MRVLVVTSVFPLHPSDATPPFVLNLCRDLAKCGVEQTILAPHAPGAPCVEARDGLLLRRFRYAWPPRLQSLCYGGGMLIRLRQNPRRALLLPPFALAQYAAIARALSTTTFDLIHAHSLLPQGLLAALANGCHLPIVTASHGNDVLVLKPRWKPLLRRTIALTDAFIANSQHTRTTLRALGAPAARTFRIPATPNFPDPSAPSHAPSATPTILFAGRLIPEKGVDALLAALPLIRTALPDCRLRIAGDGELAATLRKQAASSLPPNAVDFTGWLSSDALRAAMQAATVLVAPSRFIEGQNLVVTEALSVGCPVAATPSGGLNDLILHKQTGWVLPTPVSPANLAATLVQILTAPELRRQLGSRGFHHFKAHFSRAAITRATLDLYHQLADRPATPTPIPPQA